MISNDPANSKLILTLKGEIVVDVQARPRTVAFGQVGKGQKAAREFSTVVNDPTRIQISEVILDDKRFKLTPKSDNQAPGTQYDVAFLGSDELGRLSTSIRVKFKGAAEGEPDFIDVPVRVNVVGNLRYSKNLYFLKRDGAYTDRNVVISTRSGKPIQIKKVEDPDKKLSIKIVEKAGQRVSINAAIADPSVAYEKPSRHKLFISTTDKDEPKIEIGYTISERRGPMRRRRAPTPMVKSPVVVPKKSSTAR